MNDFRTILKSLSHGHDTHRVFEGFVCLAACAVAAQTREAEYLDEAKRWNRDELNLFSQALGALVVEMEKHAFEDLIGGYYMEFALSDKGRQWNGEFHTPKAICDLMARLIVGDVSSLPVEGPITVCEPACGAGAMILSVAELCPPEVRRRLLVTAIDISRTACHMTFINTTLWGIPTRVIHGNTISMECWSAWSNIHYLMPWVALALTNKSAESVAQGQPPTPEEVVWIKAALRQQEFGF